MAHGEIFASITACLTILWKQIFFGLFPNAEGNTFQSAQEQSAMDLRLWLLRAHYSWISWLMVMHLLQSLLCLACFYETKFHLAISKCGVKYFEQPAMDLCLQLIKAQNSWILWLMDVSGCLTLLLLKCPCSQTCQLRSAKWCYVSYFQRLEICMQIRSVNFRKFTRTWFATRVFIFRPPETLLCVLMNIFWAHPRKPIHGKKIRVEMLKKGLFFSG